MVVQGFRMQRRPLCKALYAAVRQWDAMPLVVTVEEVLAEAEKWEPEVAAFQPVLSSYWPDGDHSANTLRGQARDRCHEFRS